jgi:hypothetical protein
VNTGENAEVGTRALENGDYEGVNNAMDRVFSNSTIRRRSPYNIGYTDAFLTKATKERREK